MLVLFIACGLSALGAGRAQLGTIFLEGKPGCEIGLIDHRAAVTLDIARAGLLLLRRAAALLWAMAPVESGTNIRISARKIYASCSFIQSEKKFRFPNRMTGTDMLDCNAVNDSNARKTEAW